MKKIDRPRNRKLSVSRETLRILSGRELDAVGGGIATSCVPECNSGIFCYPTMACTVECNANIE